jgi:hypothetical protein
LTFAGERRDGKMEANRIAITVANVSAGFIVVLMGFEMLPFPLNTIWVVFNLWLWIVLPIVILWAKNKERYKEVLN